MPAGVSYRQALRGDFAAAADVWSVSSFSELRKDGIARERK
ncbi:MAG: hypothetical protein ACYSTL_07310 [Planctomycetota bacterium]